MTNFTLHVYTHRTEQADTPVLYTGELHADGKATGFINQRVIPNGASPGVDMAGDKITGTFTADQLTEHWTYLGMQTAGAFDRLVAQYERETSKAAR